MSVTVKINTDEMAKTVGIVGTYDAIMLYIGIG